MALFPPYPPPEINIEPEHCPEAVIEWYMCSASTDQRRNAELSLKAKKHLISLGWEFWYYNKKTRWELRYKSPTNGRNYISLRTACKACIDDGGSDPQNPSFMLQPPPPPPPPSTAPIVSSSPAQQQQQQEEEEEPQNNADAEQQISLQTVVETEPDPESPSSITISSSALKLKSRKICKKPHGNTRRCQKRKKGDFDETWTPTQASSSSSCGGKKGKVLRSRKKVRHVDEAQSSDLSHRNPRTIISWLIDNKVVLPEAKVHCSGAKNVEKSGKLLPSGVACDCCGSVFTITRFEAHANCTKHRPCASILLDDGRSLMDCQREALGNSSQENTVNDDSVKGEDLIDQNDSICSVCLDCGELLLCDRCPSSFHPACVGLDAVPDGDWFCPPCCCKICNFPRFREDEHADNNIIACYQCEKNYHIGCLRTRGFTELKKHPDEVWLCNGACTNIYLRLQMMVGIPIPVDKKNLTWTVLKSVKCGDLDIERLSLIQSKLSVALWVMHEGFNPIIDALSGRDMVADVIFSRASRLKRLNFRGFYTVILEKNDEVISVANIRIFGNKVAEVPLVATRMPYRMKGMCRMLMDAIEKKLSELGVERMVLPAAPDLVDAWTNSFGFSKMTDSDRREYLDYTFLEFQGTTMCHKSVRRPRKLRLARYKRLLC